MKVFVVDEKGTPLDQPYILRLQGWTEQQYLAEAPQDRKCEFVEGEVIVMGPTSHWHEDVLSFLIALLRNYVDAKRAGQMRASPTIRFRPQVLREPDICFFSAPQLPLPKEVPLTTIPSFIIEISWATRSLDLGEKARDYEAAGVREYWVVDLDAREVVVHRLEEGYYQVQRLRSGRLESQIVVGFWIQLEWLWQDPLPSAYQCLQQIFGEGA